MAPLRTVLLENEDLRVCIVNLGLRTHSLEFRAGSSWVPVIRSLNSIAAHREDDAAFGALVGRAAGRTRDGLAMIAGTSIQLDQNHGRHHLHGGQQGMTQATRALKQTGHSLSATLVSKDGEMGYPGKLQLHCTIRLDGRAFITSLRQRAQRRLTLTPLGITIFVWEILTHSSTKSSRLMRPMLLRMMQTVSPSTSGLCQRRYHTKQQRLLIGSQAIILKSINLRVSIIISLGTKTLCWPCLRLLL